MDTKINHNAKTLLDIFKEEIMLVILQKEQILSTQSICQNCLWANQNGNPRWHQGKLGCGYGLNTSEYKHTKLYQCQMGFRLVNIE